MNLLSIFSFKTLKTSIQGILSSLAITTLTIVGVSYALELNDAAGTFNGWNNPFYAAKENFANAIYKKHGRIDILHLSSSIGNQTRTGQWQEATGDQVVCFNGAVGGQHPSLARLLFEKVYFPRYKIRNVIYSLCPRDINGRGSNAPHHNHMWESQRVRSLRDDLSVKDRIVTAVEDFLYIFSARKHIHRLLVDGKPQEDLMYMDVSGSLPPSAKTFESVTPTDADKSSSRNAYQGYSVSQYELKQLLELGKFCKKNGIRFTVMNQPVSPFAYALMPNPEDDYREYEHALEQLRMNGIDVIDMKKDLKMPTGSFSDPDHMNQRGGHAVTDYIYTHVISKWFPQLIIWKNIPHPAELAIAEFLPRNHNLLVRQLAFDNVFANPLQVELNAPHTTISLPLNLPNGRYHLVLHSYIAPDEEHRDLKNVFMFRMFNTQTLDKTTFKSLDWKATWPTGAGVSRLAIAVDDEPAKLEIALNPAVRKNVVLDSITITPAMDNDTKSEFPPLPIKIHPEEPPQLIRNGGFIYSNDTDQQMSPAAEWMLYTRDREPWGTVKLLPNAVQLVHDKDTGWGSVISQYYVQSVLRPYIGRTLLLTASAKTGDRRAIFGDIRLSYTDKTSTNTKLSATEISSGSFTVSGEFEITSKTKSLTINIGSLSDAPVTFTEVSAKPVD